MSVIGDPRPAGTEGPAGDQRKAGEEGTAGDPRPSGEGDRTARADEFNPADHTVDDVKAYLANADDSERARVLNAERTGKNRATIQ